MGIKPAFSHTHKQSVADTTWTIIHGLNCKPSVSVAVDYQGTVQEIIPNSVTYPDHSTVVIGFTTPYLGTARLN